MNILSSFEAKIRERIVKQYFKKNIINVFEWKKNLKLMFCSLSIALLSYLFLHLNTEYLIVIIASSIFISILSLIEMVFQNYIRSNMYEQIISDKGYKKLMTLITRNHSSLFFFYYNYLHIKKVNYSYLLSLSDIEISEFSSLLNDYQRNIFNNYLLENDDITYEHLHSFINLINSNSFLSTTEIEKEINGLQYKL